jgi:hypothetical protein
LVISDGDSEGALEGEFRRRPSWKLPGGCFSRDGDPDGNNDGDPDGDANGDQREIQTEIRTAPMMVNPMHTQTVILKADEA